ncbi:c-type cytochrome [Deltaproteobacteria bacterium TL4]
MKIAKILTVFLSTFLSFFVYTPSAFTADGQTLYQQLTCIACHGPEGKGMVRKRDQIDKNTGAYKYREGDPLPGFEIYPKLAGQSEIYLYNQMKDIFESRRTNGMTRAMLGIKLMIDNSATDDDLKAIAKYLSQVR